MPATEVRPTAAFSTRRARVDSYEVQRMAELRSRGEELWRSHHPRGGSLPVVRARRVPTVASATNTRPRRTSREQRQSVAKEILTARVRSDRLIDALRRPVPIRGSNEIVWNGSGRGWLGIP